MPAKKKLSKKMVKKRAKKIHKKVSRKPVKKAVKAKKVVRRARPKSRRAYPKRSTGCGQPAHVHVYDPPIQQNHSVFVPVTYETNPTPSRSSENLLEPADIEADVTYATTEGEQITEEDLRNEPDDIRL